MFIPLLILSLVFITAGLIMAKYPPKKINPIYGYRTRRSMQSPETWKFAQRVSSRKMVLCGLGGLIVFITSWISDFEEGVNAVLMIATLFLSLFYLIYSVEQNLKRKFPEENY